MTPPLLSRFPKNLSTKIIDENGVDKLTLGACALVCRAFLRSSQANIFSVITLKSEDQCERLYGVLSQSPHLCNRVRTCNIAIVDAHAFPKSTTRLSALLDLLRAVVNFSLDFTSRNLHHWNTLPKALRVAVCTLCRCSRLVSLRLVCLGLLTDAADFAQLVTSPALMGLKLKDISLPAPSDGEMPLSHRIGLAALNLDLDPLTLKVITRWLVQSGSLSALRRFRIRDPSIYDLRKILDASMLSYFHLSFFHAVNIADYSNTISLPRLNKLHTLELFAIIRLPQWNPEIIPHVFQELLESTSPPERLSSIMIGFSLPFPATIPTLNWKPLENVLTSAHRFPALTRFSFEVACMPLALDDLGHALVSDIQRGMPTLQARGILQCVVSRHLG
ncbi:hypothetical protein DFH06DRAFT_1416637 [Mycena polygramma]|nr:hypothetical protein DFH06DRAFT_1416637 [Mycena polygramma]